MVAPLSPWISLARSAFFLLACGLLVGTAKADYSWSYVDVNCDQTKQQVTIRLDALWNEDPDLKWHGNIRPKSDRSKRQKFRVTNNIDYGECLLASGKPVRVKISEGTTRPYGMCGADPEIWLSVWVDRRHWLSRHQIAGRCATDLTSRIVISPTKMVVCTKKTDVPGDIPLEGVAESCKSIPSTQLPRQRDLVEYPVSRNARPEVGTIVLEHGKDVEVCQSMLRKQRDQFGRAAWFVELPPGAERDFADARDHGLYEYSGHFSRNFFDIDNDGKAEVVYGFHPSNNAHDADTYFVSSGKELDVQWPLLNEAALWKESPYVFPNAHGYCQGHPCRQEDGDGELTLKNYSRNGQKLAYRFRYLHANPFVWKGTTYFLLQTIDSTSRSVSAVVKSARVAKIEEVCVFRTVVGNY